MPTERFSTDLSRQFAGNFVGANRYFGSDDPSYSINASLFIPTFRLQMGLWATDAAVFKELKQHIGFDVQLVTVVF